MASTCADAVGRMAMSQGSDYQTACRTYYDDCEARAATGSPRWPCPLPASDCHATVLALSACLNQIAAAFLDQFFVDQILLVNRN